MKFIFVETNYSMPREGPGLIMGVSNFAQKILSSSSLVKFGHKYGAEFNRCELKQLSQPKVH